VSPEFTAWQLATICEAFHDLMPQLLLFTVTTPSDVPNPEPFIVTWPPETSIELIDAAEGTTDNVFRLLAFDALATRRS